MSRDARNAQLLEVAAALVRSSGADALTLARLAEEAGVTRPVVYEHFETRTGLLKQLYRYVDERQSQAVRAALDTEAGALDQAVAILAAAYVDCALQTGSEFGSITAALSAIIEMEDFLREERQRYVDLLASALERFGYRNTDEAQAKILGMIGAAEVLSHEVAKGAMPRARAVNALSDIMRGGLSEWSLAADGAV